MMLIEPGAPRSSTVCRLGRFTERKVSTGNGDVDSLGISLERCTKTCLSSKLRSCFWSTELNFLIRKIEITVSHCEDKMTFCRLKGPKLQSCTYNRF